MEYTPNTYTKNCHFCYKHPLPDDKPCASVQNRYIHTQYAYKYMHTCTHVSDGCKGRKKNLILQNRLWLEVTSTLSRWVQQQGMFVVQGDSRLGGKLHVPLSLKTQSPQNEHAPAFCHSLGSWTSQHVTQIGSWTQFAYHLPKALNSSFANRLFPYLLPPIAITIFSGQVSSASFRLLWIYLKNPLKSKYS